MKIFETPANISKIYITHYKDLYLYGLKFTGDIELLRDAINDVFGHVCHNANYLKNASNPKAYLLVCLKRQIVKLKLSQERALFEVANFNSEDTSYDPQQELHAHHDFLELQDKLAKAIAALSLRQQEVIRMRYFENQSFEEISGRTGVSIKTLYNTTYNALQILKTEVKIPLFMILIKYFYS